MLHVASREQLFDDAGHLLEPERSDRRGAGEALGERRTQRIFQRRQMTCRFSLPAMLDDALDVLGRLQGRERR